MELILIDQIEGALVSSVSGVCSPGGCPCVASGKELGDRTSREGGEMTASSRAPRLRSLLSPLCRDQTTASHRRLLSHGYLWLRLLPLLRLCKIEIRREAGS